MEFLNELHQACETWKKEMTREMVKNTPTWKKFKADNKAHFEKVGHPQQAITDLAPKYA